MKRRLAFLPLLTAVGIGMFFVWGLDPDRDPNAIPSVLISKPAPDFDLPPVPGIDMPGLARSDLDNADGVTVLNVFASWCVPCQAEHAVLSRMTDRPDIRLVGINYKDRPEDAVDWLRELGNPYARIGSDRDGRAGIEWGISGVPETFILGSSGRVLFRHVGPIVGDDAISEFAAALDEALGGSSGDLS